MANLKFNPLTILPIILAGSLGIVMSAHAASSDAKIATIKSIYSQCLANYSVSGGICQPYLYKKSSKKLKMAFQAVAGFDDSDGICMDGVDATIWDSSDPDVKTRINYQLTKAGQVKVNFGYGGKVTYALDCSSGQCLVTDLYDRNGNSYTKQVQELCL